jgi:penicillin-binding protein 2
VTETRNVPIDPNGWTFITDAMSRVLLPEGTAPSAHIPGIDIAGKTGSAQIVSLATRARFKNSEDLAQNGWFVGFTPRRNPDIIVCVLFEGGEHGRLAARLATQVLKAYVDKQRRLPNKMVEKTKGDGKVDMGALWTAPESDRVEGGRATLNLPRKRLAWATAAPGIQ